MEPRRATFQRRASRQSHRSRSSGSRERERSELVRSPRETRLADEARGIADGELRRGPYPPGAPNALRSAAVVTALGPGHSRNETDDEQTRRSARPSDDDRENRPTAIEAAREHVRSGRERFHWAVHCWTTRPDPLGAGVVHALARAATGAHSSCERPHRIGRVGSWRASERRPSGRRARIE